MNPAITDFVEFLVNAANIAKDGTPNYANIRNFHYDYALGLISKDNQAKRIEQALLGFNQRLKELYDYLKNNHATLEERIYLLKNLDNFLKALPENEFKTHKYSVSLNDDDAWAQSAYVTEYIKCPVNETGVNIELNALSSFALAQISSFNDQNITDQSVTNLSAASEKLRVVPIKEEEVLVAAGPSFFYVLASNMLIFNDNFGLSDYQGLSRLKTYTAFTDSLVECAREFIAASASPFSIRDTVAYKLAATPRTTSMFTLFGTRTQNMFEGMIKENMKQPRHASVVEPSAPPMDLLPVASPIVDTGDHSQFAIKPC